MIRSIRSTLQPYSQWIIGLFPIFAVIGFLIIRVRWFNVYETMIQEDAWIENVEAVMYLLSALACVWLAYKSRQNRWLAGLFILAAVILLFVTVEEISWGQRIFMIKTPRYFKRHNFQREISVHNLMPIQWYLQYLYILVGGFLSFS